MSGHALLPYIAHVITMVSPCVGLAIARCAPCPRRVIAVLRNALVVLLPTCAMSCVYRALTVCCLALNMIAPCGHRACTRALSQVVHHACTMSYVRVALTTPSPCACHGVATHCPCYHAQPTMPSPCHYHAIAMMWPCLGRARPRHDTPMPSACSYNGITVGMRLV